MIQFAFLISFIVLILQGTCLSWISLSPFAPFLALVILRKPLLSALWLGAIGGVCVDLFCNDPFGIHALNCTLTLGLIFRLKHRFSSDEPLHLSVFAVLISSVSTLLQMPLLFLFDRAIPDSGKWIWSDIAAMPVLDGVYAFCAISVPIATAKQLRKMWTLYWLKRKNQSPSLT